MQKVGDFDSIKISLASPDDILSWSFGEVVKPETINYRTQRPEKDGLFCEKIFGPTRDYECYCGKYRRIRYKGIVCDKCGVEITKSSVRRERMGHIKLAVPVTHIWFLRGSSSRIGSLLSESSQQLERVVYFMAYIVTKVDEEAKKQVIENIEKEFKQKKKTEKEKEARNKLTEARNKAIQEVNSIKKCLILKESDYRKFSLKYGEVFEAGTGAEAIKKLLEGLDFEKLEKELEEKHKQTKTNKKKIQQKLGLVRGFISSGIKPEWTCLTVLPVLPPDVRPMVQLEGGRYASSDLNDLYRRVINRNNRLKYLKKIGAPEVIIRNEKRMLQEAVDALIDNSARKPQMVGATTGGKRQLKSLADILRGKQGRFRQNLLGKRVDYSGRSVIIIGPDLKLDEVGLPKKMALELFKPFIINKIIERGLAHNVRAAGILISEGSEEVWEILEETTKGKYVLLNRAPTLHRLSIQAFKPVLTEGKAIQIHPLICPAFNADFDGDQMAVHLPLSKEAQKEARDLMSSVKGIIKPATGQPIAIPRQEMILGCYFLTSLKEGALGKGKIFPDSTGAKLAYEFGELDLRAKIKIRITEKEVCAVDKNKIIETSVGRIIFNEALPQDLPFQNEVQGSKQIQSLISRLMDRYEAEKVVVILDEIKRLGFEYATTSSTTWGMCDLVCPKDKDILIKEAEKKEREIKKQYLSGFLSEKERKDKVIGIWQGVKDKISDMIPSVLPEHGPIFSIINSGSRGSWSQPGQMAGMKGLVSSPSGEIIELPVKNSYKQGLTTLEYFISTHGARKGTADTALRTSTAGYLTRRLVDVAHELIVREEDCGDKKGIIISKEDAKETEQNFSAKIVGRILLEDAKVKEKIIFKKGKLIGKDDADKIENSDIQELRVRSPLSCVSDDGICQRCYGADLSTYKIVDRGIAIGVIAAQAIGEPGTQLTMRTFHAGGVVGIGDITLGLPRAEEILEVRSPKGEALIFEEDGKIEEVSEKKGETIIKVKTDKQEKKEYKIPTKTRILVKKGDLVIPGQPIIDGRVNLKKLFRVAGIKKTKRYILKEIQNIYTSEGVAIHDKHIETIIHQLFSRVKIVKSGDSNLSVDDIFSLTEFNDENERLRSEGKNPASAKPVILGLTKVALLTNSFLSAASFQETSRTLIKSATKGKEDKLKGLKENVIIGKLIPAGTGFKEKLENKQEEKKKN